MTHPSGPIVVVGGGQAGGWAAKTLRDQGFQGKVVLVAAEHHPPHERPPLSKTVLSGAAHSDTTHVFEPQQLETFNIDTRLGTEALTIDRKQRTIFLSDGQNLEYSHLILCCGGRARRLNLPGADLPNIYTLRSIQDAHLIRDALSTARKLVVIGGGWLGLEVAAVARQRGIKTTVLETQSRICQRSVPESIATFLTALHERNGVEFQLGCAIRAFRNTSSQELEIELESGQRLAADAVVAAVGLIPNDELARESGILTQGGILVDCACRTSDPYIFAAGDVAVAPNRRLGRAVRLESWQNAQDQACAAARAALGEHVHYDPLPRFWSDQYDCTVQIIGFPDTADRSIVRGDIQSNRFIQYYLRGHHVIAAIAVNSPRDLRAAQKLIESEIPVDDDLEPFRHQSVPA